MASLRTMSNNIYIKVGPHGVKKGEAWDDGISETPLTIFLSYSDDRVHSIQLAYVDQQGNRVLSPRHGGDGPKFETIQITGGFVTSVSGWHGSFIGWGGILSITFEADGRIHGPYGRADRPASDFHTPFCFNGCIKGFHGVSEDGGYLNAIGVYVDSKVPKQSSYAPKNIYYNS